MAPFNAGDIRALFLDMDGVLWTNKTPIGDLARIFEKIEQAGLIPLFGTNNSTKTPMEYVEKLAGFGVHVTPEQFFTAGIATVRKLKSDFPNGPRVHVFGSDSLKKLLADNGIALTDEDADAVLVSMDRGISYEKIARAMHLIRGGAKFYATNTDSTFATEHGWNPGGGVMVKAVEYCTDVQPYVIGKPNTLMMELACESYGLRPEQVLAVGDRHETDIMGGVHSGAHTALVLTGYETEETLPLLNPRPDMVCRDLDEVVSFFLGEA